MTAQQVSRYITLANRIAFISAHSGIDWKPEYGPELERIRKELAELRPLVDAEHQKRGGEQRCRRT